MTQSAEDCSWTVGTRANGGGRSRGDEEIHQDRSAGHRVYDGNKLMTGRAGGEKYIGMSLRNVDGVSYILDVCLKSLASTASGWISMMGGASANTQ